MAAPVINDTMRRLSDSKAVETLNAISKARATQAAVEFIAKSGRDKAAAKRMSDLARDQANVQKQIDNIKHELQEALDHTKRAESVYTQLSTLSSVFTLASQVASIHKYMGSSAPSALGEVKSKDDITNIMKDDLAKAQAEGQAIQLQYDHFTDQKNEIDIEQLNVIRSSGYPLGDVPQTGLP